LYGVTAHKRGAHVTLCARGEKSLQAAAASIKKTTGADILNVSADMTKEKDCNGVIDQTVDLVGHYKNMNVSILLSILLCR